MVAKLAQSHSPLPAAVTDACRALGERIEVARKRRRLTQKALARRAGLSAYTLIRIEQGVPGTELGSVVRVLWALGLERSLSLLADPAADEAGQTLERGRLPRRVRVRTGSADDEF